MLPLLYALLLLLRADTAQVDVRLRRTDDFSFRDVSVTTDRISLLLRDLNGHVTDCVMGGVYALTNRCSHSGGRVACSRVAVLETDEDAHALRSGDIVEVTCAESFIFKETFDDNWESRWEQSTKHPGRWKHRAARQCNGSEASGPADKGIATTSDRQVHVIAAQFKEFRTKGKELVVHYQVKFEQPSVGCSGGYLKLFSKGFHKDNIRGGDFALMFGPDVCAEQNKSVLVVHFNKRTEPLNIPMEFPDQMAHTYTLQIHPNSTFKVYVDLELRLLGTLDPYQGRPRDLPGNIGWAQPLSSQRRNGVGLHSFETITCVAIDVYQEQGGTLFDNILLTEDIDTALRFARRTWDKGCNISPLNTRAPLERELLHWFAENARSLHGFRRAVHAAVMVGAGSYWGTCLMLTLEGHMLCNSHPNLEASHGMISVALNGPEVMQHSQVVYLARMVAEDVALGLSLLQLDTTCCEDFRPVTPGRLNVAITSYHTHPAIYKVGKKVAVLCLNDANNAAPTPLTTIESAIEAGPSGKYLRLSPPPECSGGLVVDEDGAFLGLGELASRRPADAPGAVLPITAALHLVELAQRDARGADLMSG